MVNALKDANTKMFAYDTHSGNLCALGGIDKNERVASILSELYERTPMQGCSLAPADNLQVYIRRDLLQERAARGNDAEKNVATGKPTTSSSSLGNALPSAAVDGNTDGVFDHGSTTHSVLERNPWWQVDLGRSVDIDHVTIWNRTDCCSERLRHYWVLLSDNPFSVDENLDDLKREAETFKGPVNDVACPSETVHWNHAHGRYVRIQLEGEGFLSLAEVQVFSSPSTSHTETPTVENPSAPSIKPSN